MKYNLLLVLLVAGMASAYGQSSRTPDARRALICLTYDDGLPSHLATVLPQLDSAGLQATFFLNAIQGASTVIGESSPAVVGWTQAARRGHELANHTLFHACPEQLGWTKPFATDGYTVERMVSEIKAENALLALLDPGRKTRAFAYPCNNFLIGRIDYRPLIQQQGLVSYARGGGDRTSFATYFRAVNPMQVPSWMVEEGTALPELIAFAERVKKAGGLGVYQFHGVGGKFFRISAATHRAFLAYLRAHADEYQVVTFSDALRLVTAK
ncbi:polysaccharide deacetylase family protein [Hymenobacter swuensis]|uniref:Polysaccharide deacetylase family protein n=1 Tax=Hymenobacter swuensis DY53 TaxID=1227739 RepID=W8F0D1_9BACT|nr:polysaccharide deacetylase family protein [Hymenobacter swuensis]AHJ95335.1 Polysaccharide deacetylase family protein [Hymenobacter swuensis DY53]